MSDIRAEALREAADELGGMALALMTTSSEVGYALTAAVVSKCEAVIRERADRIDAESA